MCVCARQAHYRKAAAHFHMKEYDAAYAAFSKSTSVSVVSFVLDMHGERAFPGPRLVRVVTTVALTDPPFGGRNRR